MIRRREVIIATGGGFSYFFCHGVGFLTAGLVSFAAPVKVAAMVYAVVALPALLAAVGLGRIIGTPRLGAGNELRGLLVSLYCVPVVVIPGGVVLALSSPHDVPLLVAVVFGGHLVPLGWVLSHRGCSFAGVLLILLVAGLYLFMGKGAFHFVGVVGGIAVIVGAWVAWRHVGSLSMRAGD